MDEPLDPTEIGFRRLAEDDLPLMHRWLNTDFVHEWWWNGVEPSYAAIIAKYTPRIRGEEPMAPYLILSGDLPIGYIQAYMIRDDPDYAVHVGVDADAAGVDLFIGAADYLHKGLGSHILRAFLRVVIFGAMGAASCVIGPSVDNRIAIRAYEKAGFRYLKTVTIPDEETPEYLMTLARTEMGEQ